MPDWYLDLLKTLEGFRSTAYWDKGHYSIGYGSDTMPDGKPVTKDSKITKAQADVQLKAHVDKSVSAARKEFPKFDSYPEQAQAAILDVMYRGGTGAFAKSPKFKQALIDALDDGNVTTAELQGLMNEMGYATAPDGVKDRKGRRVAMLAGVYDPTKNNTAYSKQSPYLNISTNPNTVWGQVLRTRDLGQNFTTRLWDPNRESISDWESNKTATHKLSYKTTSDGYDIVYPEVQQATKKGLFGTKYTDGLIDYTNPQNSGVDAYEKAVQMGDTIHVPAGMGDRFTKTYKKYYPGFKKNGGNLNYLNYIQ